MEISIFWLAILCIASAVVGIFIYRNNVNMFDPFADKLDDKFDEIERKLKQQIKDLESDLKKR